MSGTYGESLDETDDRPDSFEVEGIQAFNRLAGAVQGLESRLSALEHGLSARGRPSSGSRLHGPHSRSERHPGRRARRGRYTR